MEENIETINSENIPTYMLPFDSIKLNSKNQSMLESRLSDIQAKSIKTAEAVKELLEYLENERNNASLLEAQEEEHLKKQGIIIGQHIPSLPSKLNIDRDYLTKFGRLSANLIIARELVNQNRENMLRRTGNLPISQAAIDKKAERGKYQEMMESDAPNYLQATGVAKNREEAITKRFSETLKAQAIQKATYLKLNPKPERITFEHKELMKAEDRILNEEVIKSMNHKLNYLRNPKNLSTSIGQTLIKSPK